MSRPRGFKKGFLLRPWTDGAEVGEDAGGAQDECGCSFVEHSDLDSEVCSESGFFLDEFKLNEAVNGGVVSEKFMLKQAGKGLQEYFLSECSLPC